MVPNRIQPPFLPGVQLTGPRVPPNVRFEVDDVESEWTYSRKFDFIHCRCMYAAIQNWPRLVGQVYE